MSWWAKLRRWMTFSSTAAPNTIPAEESEVLTEGLVEKSLETTVEQELPLLSEEEQQRQQIKELLASSDMSNHELAAMFLMGLQQGWEEDMYALVVGSAEKLTFWAGQEDNDEFLQPIKALHLGPRFFREYSEIAAFAAIIPKLIYLKELYWEASHYWNQHPILVAASQLPNLQVLHFCDCKMNYLPDALVEATQLKALYLSGNKLTELPERLELLSELRVLDLSSNALKKCPRSIGGLRRLEVLRLHKNPMDNIEPRLLGRLYRLKDLRLPPEVAKSNLEALKDWLPDVDFEQSYWKFEE
ncbi:MAG: leucine-rich repeat domain-containing protein [Aureispira sp.]